MNPTATIVTAAADPSTFEQMAMFIQGGGIFLWSVLIIWAFGIAITIERTKAFYHFDIDGPSLMNVIKKFVLENNVAQAIQSCSNSKALLPFVLRAGLKRANQSKEQIQDTIEAAILEVKPKLERRTDYLGLIANLSTLLGLLGTINGLIVSFSSVATVDPALKSKMLAAGIAHAMNATATGLVAAITMMIAHAILTSKSNKIVSEIEEFSWKLVDLLGTKKPQSYSKEVEIDKAA